MKRDELADQRMDDYADPTPSWPSVIAMGALLLALAVFGGLVMLEWAQAVWEWTRAR